MGRDQRLHPARSSVSRSDGWSSQGGRSQGSGEDEGMSADTSPMDGQADEQDTQTRIRQGLKENLRTSNEQYEDNLKGTLNKLKRSYWSKCQAVEVSYSAH
jgi:hypothetical protein